MKITIFYNPRCSKSRAALALLKSRGIEPRIVEYLTHPPTADELRRICKLLDMRPRELLRSADAKQAGIDPDTLDDDRLMEEMVARPALIERPIVISEKQARLGRPPERVLEIL